MTHETAVYKVADQFDGFSFFTRKGSDLGYSQQRLQQRKRLRKRRLRILKYYSKHRKCSAQVFWGGHWGFQGNPMSCVLSLSLQPTSPLSLLV